MTSFEEGTGPDAVDDELGMDPPSKGIAVLMIVVGIVFLLPFIFLSVAAGPINPAGLLSAFLTVGWTFALGLVFLLYGWKRLKSSRGVDADEV